MCPSAPDILRPVNTSTPAEGLRVIWLSHSDTPGLHPDPGLLRHHRSAGRRLRVGIPAAWLQSAGVEQWLLSPPADDGLAQALALKPDLVMVSGLHPNVDGLEDGRGYFDCIHAFRRAGVRIVVDFGENHFQDARAPAFRETIELSDALIITTQSLADIIEEKTGRTSIVIADPVEGARREPAFNPPPQRSFLKRLLKRAQPRPLKLLWFGGQGRNYFYLKALIPQLQAFACETPLELTLVTGPIEGIDADIDAWNRASPAFQARLEYWSPSVLEQAMAACDAVIIPSDVAARMAASANRMTESIWAGRFVVAHGLPSYWEFRESAWIGEDLIAGLRWALAHPDEALARIARGQDIIAARHTPEVIGPLWGEAFAKLAGR